MDISSSPNQSRLATFQNFKLRSGLAFGIIILTALVAFEIFNYSTTDYALRDLLGDLRFAGIRWATILSIAFCGIDFAGIARLFTPEQGSDEPREVWYLFGAWLLAATMNAILTWWGVSMAVTNHAVSSSQTVVDPKTLTSIVPVFVSVMVWVIRILLIGSLSYAGDRIFTTDNRRKSNSASTRRLAPGAVSQRELNPALMAPRPVVNRTIGARPVNQRSIATPPEPIARPEPTYHSLSARSAAHAPLMGDNPNNRH